MNTFDTDYAAGRLDHADPPCLSIYQTTHRHHPDNQQDPVRFGNLVKQLKESLLQQHEEEEVLAILKPFHALEDDRAFWNHTLDGLAVLGAKGFFRTYKLQRPVGDLAVVADTFHIKPLMRVRQSADRYHVLGLNRHEVKLFEGNRDALDEIPLHKDVPRTMTEALGQEITEPHLTAASYGGAGGSQPAMHHGHGGKKAEVDNDAERFFRIIDRAIRDHHSKPSGLPLILASLPDHHHMFHEISDNPFLVEQSIDIHPDAVSSPDQFRERAWQVMEPTYRARLDKLVEAFGNAHAKGHGDSELAPIAKAVVDGRVATLLIEADREIPGRIDAETGDIAPDDLSNPHVDDALDDLGMLALKRGTQLVVVPREQMPTTTGIAAIYRY